MSRAKDRFTLIPLRLIADDHRTIVVSCLRTSAYRKVALDDFTFSGINEFLWTQIGPGISFMVASSLVARPVFDKIFYQSRLSVSKLRKENSRRWMMTRTNWKQRKMISRAQKPPHLLSIEMKLTATKEDQVYQNARRRWDFQSL